MWLCPRIALHRLDILQKDMCMARGPLERVVYSNVSYRYVQNTSRLERGSLLAKVV